MDSDRVAVQYGSQTIRCISCGETLFMFIYLFIVRMQPKVMFLKDFESAECMKIIFRNVLGDSAVSASVWTYASLILIIFYSL